MSRADSFLKALEESGGTPAAKTRPKREWKPLLGQMLEYGDSGYIIVLQKAAKKPPFSLRDPDGREIASGDKLPAMKAYAEEQARFRDEFDMGVAGLSGMPDFKRFQTGGE